MGLTLTRKDKEHLEAAYYQTVYALGSINHMLEPGMERKDMRDDADFARCYVAHAQRMLKEVLVRHGVKPSLKKED